MLLKVLYSLVGIFCTLKEEMFSIFHQGTLRYT